MENLPEHDKPFDCIVWQFPHAGFPEEEKNEHRGPGFEWGDDFTTRHTDLLKAFFKGVRAHLIVPNGKVVISHKTIEPFSLWDIPGIAKEAGFTLIETIPFNKNSYPGYLNRRGAGK